MDSLADQLAALPVSISTPSGDSYEGQDERVVVVPVALRDDVVAELCNWRFQLSHALRTGTEITLPADLPEIGGMRINVVDASDVGEPNHD